MAFINELQNRNSILFYFGLICVIGVFYCVIMIFSSNTQVLGINAWIKPLKFFLSTVIFVWSMAWYMHYLPQQFQVKIYSWVVLITLSFELIYITYQAARGELSHFNVSTAFHGTMFSLMGLAITIMTLHTASIGLLFFSSSFPELPTSYLWGIRMGIILFVFFAFEGGIMGAKLAHTVGAPDGGDGLPLVNWSKSAGDLRIAHFVGMHALQILPLLGFYVIGNSSALIITSVIYFLITSGVMIQALMGFPLIK